MKLIPIFSVAVVIVAILSGCSGGGGRNQIAGRQCPATYAPIEMTKIPQKTWKKGENESSIPVGTYSYQSADLIYTEKGEKGAIVHIKDLPVGGVFKTSIYCVRNALNISEKNISFASNLASKIIAKTGGSPEVETKEISFRTLDRRLVSESKALEKTDSLEKAYEGKSTELFLIDALNNQTDYEVRSTFSDNTGSFILSVKFRRTLN
jgi:uncharacterized protein YceK